VASAAVAAAVEIVAVTAEAVAAAEIAADTAAVVAVAAIVATAEVAVDTVATSTKLKQLPKSPRHTAGGFFVPHFMHFNSAATAVQ
jgi:hypothetical protein